MESLPGTAVNGPQSLEQSLAREKDFSQAILDTAQGLICCMDIEGRFLVFNRACQALTGFSEGEALGRYYWEVVIPPEQAEDRRRRFALLKEGYITGAVEVTWMTRAGERKLISWQTAILRDAAGSISGVVATGVDVTEKRKAEQALAREQAFVRALIDRLPDGLLACDETGALKLMNRRAREFHGAAKDQDLGPEWSDFNLYTADGRLLDKPDTPLFQALHGEQVRDCELVVAPKDRRARFLLCAADPLADEEGNRIGAVVQMHDDTERRAAEQFLRQSEQRLREQNLQLECLFGLAREFTQSLSRVRLKQSLDSAVRRIQQLLGADNCRLVLESSGGGPVTAHQASTADGIWTMAAGLERATGPFGQVVVYQTTPRTWRESEKKWLEAVADLIGNAIERVEMIEDLAVQKERALDASQAKTRFLANMSHEIRTPLNGVLGLVQVIQRADDISTAHRQTLEMVRNCGAHLLGLVNDILDLSRIESGRLEFAAAPANPRALLRELSDVFAVSARDKGLSLKVAVEDSCPSATITDERRLRQILFNLIGNGIKFTGRGEVAVEARGEAETIVFRVSDTGPGIAAEELARLFQPFERGAAHQSTPGTGLGLAISSRLAQGLGGRIDAESQPGAGSVFTVRIPHRPAGAAEPPREPSAAPASAAEKPLWHEVASFRDAFVAQLDQALVPAILSGDLDGIADALSGLREAAAAGREVEFLEEVKRRADAFEFASLYPLAERIRGAKAA